MKSRKISECCSNIEEMKASILQMLKKHQTHQVTIRWTDNKKKITAITTTNHGEQCFQCSAGKVLLHRREISIMLPCRAMPCHVVPYVCVCVSLLLQWLKNPMKEINHLLRVLFIYLIFFTFFSFCCCSLLSLQILRWMPPLSPLTADLFSSPSHSPFLRFHLFLSFIFNLLLFLFLTL